MFGKWKASKQPEMNQVEILSPAIDCVKKCCPQHVISTTRRRQLAKGFYFCLVQSVPTPSSFIFTTSGEYIIGCGCFTELTLPLVTLPLGTSPKCTGACAHLRVKVRDRSISVRQFASSLCYDKENGPVAPMFAKETFSKGLEAFSHVDSAENCNFRMFSGSAFRTNGKQPNPDDFPTCSFAIRRVLLGTNLNNRFRLCKPGAEMESDATNGIDELSPYTEYETSVSKRVEVFQDLRIGKGGNGEVFLGIHRSYGTTVAVKREPKDMLRHEFSLIVDIRLDGLVLRYKAQDPHPSKFLWLLAHSVALDIGNTAVAAAIAHHSAVDDDSDHLVLELVAGGELRKQVKTKYSSGMPLEMARAYIYQVVCGVMLIHSKKVIHRDLKTQNILVRHGNSFQEDELKIIDFGNSAKVKPGTVLTKNYTTCFACAPEQFALPEHGYGYAIDIWAIGTIFYELLTGERLFECLNINEASKLIPAFKERDVRAHLPYLRPDAMDFLLKCLTKDPEQRPSALQLLTTPFLFPLHLFQISRRLLATNVYNTYMTAFERGWESQEPLESLSMAEPLFYDKDSRSYIPHYHTSEALNVVLPVYECPPIFESQDHGIQICNWILGSDASFQMTPKRVDELRCACRGRTPSESTSRGSSLSSLPSTESSELFEELCSPQMDKTVSDMERLGTGTTCSTTSFPSLPNSPANFEDDSQPGGNKGMFEALADRIDCL